MSSALFAMGSNGSGQLGIGHKEDVSVPKPVLFERQAPDRLVQIKAGGKHTLLLSSTGILYCCGDGNSGACGLTSNSGTAPGFREINLEANPQASNEPHLIRFCTATWEASVIVQQDGEGRATTVSTFGTGNKGELGLGELIFRTSKAETIKDFPPAGLEIVDLAASVSHVVAVMSSGDVYGWGSGRKGQLGQPDGILGAPRKLVGIDFKVVRVVCGREFTYLLGDPATGQHTILGSDKWNVRSSGPQSVAGWKDVGASWGSIFVLQDDGKLLSWGRNDHGQLAPGGLPLLKQIAIGSEHAVVLTDDGDVLAWGWGEHGNCGPNTTNGDVKGRWNIIATPRFLPSGANVSSIGAGCATSWVSLSG